MTHLSSIMVVTSVNVPDGIFRFMEQLISEKKVRNKREVLIRAIAFCIKYDVFNWSNSSITIDGFRKALIDERFMRELSAFLNEKDLYEIGRKYGKALYDQMQLSKGKDISNPSNYKLAFENFGDMGWGEFKAQGKGIRIDHSMIPQPLLRGYLESGLKLRLDTGQRVDHVLLFKILNRSD